MNPKEESTNPSRPDIENSENEDIVEKSQNFVKNNRNLIIVALVIIIAAAGAIWYLNNQKAEEESEASMALSKLIAPYNSGNYDQALNGDSIPGTEGGKAMGLKEIADKYDGTIQGKQAALFAATAYLSQNNYAEAKKYFEMAKDADSYLIKIGANAGLGAVMEYENNYSEAADYYDKAASIAKQDFVKQKYKYYAGLAYENAGNKDKALEIYRDIVNTNEFSEFGALAKTGLARLGTIIE